MTVVDGGAITLHAVTLSGNPIPAQASITSVSPSAGVAGDSVVIQGTSFGTEQGTVTFNGTTAVVSSWTSTEIGAFVPVGATSGPIQVVNSGGVSNSPAPFTVGPSLQSVLPESGAVGSQITLLGIGFGQQQGTSGQVLFNGVPAVPTSWSDTQIVVSVPPGATTGVLTVVQNSAISNSVPFVVLGGSGAVGPSGPLSPVLKIRVVDTPAAVNLSDSVNTDWVLWGSVSGSAALARMTGSNLISDINSTSTDENATSLDPSPFTDVSYSAQFNWTGGTVYPSSGQGGSSLTVTVPASNVVQTLKLYVAFVGSDRVTATISDGSSSQVAATSADPGYLGPRERTYLIDFRAASIPQTVAINLSWSADAWVEAAVLQPHVPEVSILSPKDGDTFGSSAEVPIGLDSLQFDSSTATVQVLSNQQQIYQFSDQPYTAQLQATAGHYQIQATATDANGLVGSSKPIQIDVIGSGGALSVSPTLVGEEQQSPIDLTSEGTADWRIFAAVPGANGLAQMAGLQKGGVASLISQATAVGDGSIWGLSGAYSNTVANGCGIVSSVYFPLTPFALEFEDAFGSTPTGVTDGCGLASEGPDSGLQFTVPATTTMQTLHVYLQVMNAHGKLKAFLSDGSAPVVIDRSSQLITEDYYHSIIYTIQYCAQSTNQTLTVQWTVDDDANVSNPNAPWEEAVLIAADVSGTAQYSRPTITSVTASSGSSRQTVSILGSGFGAAQGDGTVSFGGISASVANWSANEIDAVVPEGVCSGAITVTANGLTSNPFAFSTPFQVQITPGSTGMIVGESLQLNAVNAACQTPLSGVLWSLSPAGLASLSSDSQPTLTATGPGTLNLTATTSGVSATATIQIVSSGVAYPPTTNSPSGTVTNANSVVLTDSLGHTTTYYSAMFGGSRKITNSTGPGCSTCDIRGNNQYAYDSQGNLASTTDAMGNTVYYSYDQFGNVLSVSKFLNSGTPATTGYAYNSFNEVLTVTDPLGNVTSNAYDASGNLLSITSPAPGGGASASVTQFAYDAKGELIQITDPRGNVSKLTYTPVGLIQGVRDTQGNITSYTYDAHGNRTSIVDPAGNTTTFSYDAGDRLIKITYPDSTTSSFVYDSRGRRTSATDQNGMTTSYGYDDANRLVSVTDPSQHTTSYLYDTENNLLSITDANGKATSFDHDAYGRVIQSTFPSGLAEYYTYDLIGNVLNKKDRKGQTIQYVYDALNRLTSKQYPDGTSAEYTYDLVGRVLSVNDPTGSYGLAYDNMGRLLGTTTQYSFLPGKTLTSSYSYDASSNRTSFTGPDGGTNAYSYDNLNRLTGLANSWAGSFNEGYDALSRRTSLGRPNGVKSNYQYDNLSRLLSVLHGGGVDGANYTYDNAGNRTSKQNLLSGTTENYSYDALYELTQVVSGGNTTQSYTYDPVGNRLSSLNLSQWNYNSSNELVSTPTGTFAYDKNGNMLSKTTSEGTWNYTWDYENRLISATVPAKNGGSPATIVFQYDPLGRRIQKTSSSGSTIYLYDGSNLVAEMNSSGTVSASFVQNNGIDQPLAVSLSGVTYYYEQDGLGSVTSLTNIAGQVAVSYSYDAFGRSTESGSIHQPIRFTGREWDYETGLYFYRARYYDPAIGRFLSEDPIRFKGSGTNFYAYVRNSPINFTDPSGLCPVCIDVFASSFVSNFASLGSSLKLKDLSKLLAAVPAAFNSVSYGLTSLATAVSQIPTASSVAVGDLLTASGVAGSVASALSNAAGYTPAAILGVVDIALFNALMTEVNAALNGGCVANPPPVGGPVEIDLNTD